jgi:hypothetical protein
MDDRLQEIMTRRNRRRDIMQEAKQLRREIAVLEEGARIAGLDVPVDHDADDAPTGKPKGKRG